MKKNIIILTIRETSESFPYSALTELHKAHAEFIGLKLSTLQKKKFPIIYPHFRIDKKRLVRTEYIKTNF